MSTSSLEKTLQNLQADALADATERHPEATSIITSFAEGDCYVDVMLPEGRSQRYVWFPEEA